MQENENNENTDDIVEEQDFIKKIENNKELFNKHTKLGNNYLNEAQNCILQEHIEDAKEAIENAIFNYKVLLIINPDNPGVNNNIGAALTMDGKNTEALPYYEAAMNADEYNIVYRRNYARCLRRNGKYDQANHQFELITELVIFLEENTIKTQKVNPFWLWSTLMLTTFIIGYTVFHFLKR